MKRVVYTISLLILLSIISTLSYSKPCFTKSFYHYLYYGEGYYGYIYFKTYIMFNESDSVYVTITIYPAETIYVYTFRVRIGSYKCTLLKNDELTSEYTTTLQIPHELLTTYNELDYVLHWKPKWGTTARIDCGYIYIFIIRTTYTYVDLYYKYRDLYYQYNSLKRKYDYLYDRYDYLKKKYDSLVDNYNTLVQKYNELKTDYDSLQSEYTSLRRKYADLKYAYDNLVEKHARLSSEFNTLFFVFILLLVFGIVFLALTIKYERKAKRLEEELRKLKSK